MKIVYDPDGVIEKVKSIVFCCEKLQDGWGDAYMFDYDKARGVPALVIDDAGRTMSFCPFCGEKVEIIEAKDAEPDPHTTWLDDLIADREYLDRDAWTVERTALPGMIRRLDVAVIELNEAVTNLIKDVEALQREHKSKRKVVRGKVVRKGGLDTLGYPVPPTMEDEFPDGLCGERVKKDAVQTGSEE